MCENEDLIFKAEAFVPNFDDKEWDYHKRQIPINEVLEKMGVKYWDYDIDILE